MERKVYAVGLGPGDYEMMTLKAKRVLEESDVILLSGSKYFNSYDEVKKLLDNINCGNKIKYFEYPMQDDERQKHLNNVINELIDNVNNNKKISYVTMGDVTIFTSFPDIYGELSKQNIILEAVTGISSFFAPASLTGNSIIDWKDRAAIIPSPDDYNEIATLLETFQTVIIMKITDNGKVLREYLAHYKPTSAYTVFNAYTEKQAVYDLTKEFPNHLDFYMSVVMIKK